MDESLQQILAMLIVLLAVGIELLRRYRKKKSGNVGCDGCSTGANQQQSANGETKLRFYRRHG